MKFAMYSDLHLEFTRHEPWQPPELNVDVVILAGDVGVHTEGLDWARNAFSHCRHSPEVIYIAGNHEFYRSHLGLLEQLGAPEWKTSGIHFLENDVLFLSGVRILGCTLWSDFGLYGPDMVKLAMNDAKAAISDYRLIGSAAGELLKPEDTLAMHRHSVAWLDAELSKPFDGSTVVVSHFGPHRGCVASHFEGSPLSPYFVSDCSGLMRKHAIDVWCYGHTHTNIDFVDSSGCRILSNQRGYPDEVSHGNGFRPDFIFEL